MTSRHVQDLCRFRFQIEDSIAVLSGFFDKAAGVEFAAIDCQGHKWNIHSIAFHFAQQVSLHEEPDFKPSRNRG